MITEGLQNIAEGFKKKFSRETVAATVGNPRNATRQMTQRKPAPTKAMGIKKPTVGKVGSVDTAFFTKTAEKKNPKLQKNDSVADVAGKLFSFIKTSEQERKVHFELSRDFEKENITEDTRRHNELVEALKKQREEKEKKKEPEKKEEKKPEEKKKGEPEKKAPEKAETKGKEEPGKETGNKAPDKKGEADKQAKEAKEAKEAAAQTKPPVTAKPVEPAPAAPQAPTPTATVPKPSIPSGVSTAVKITTGAVAVAGALAGKEALAENISKYESTAAGGYNAYNKGTIGNKMIGSDKPIDFSKMTISEFLKRAAKTKAFPEGNPNMKPGGPDTLFAVGRYQIIPSTMLLLVKKLKLDPDKTKLDPDTQDSLFSNGLVGVVRKKVDEYIKGLSNDKNAAILELAMEFASVGVPYDMKKGEKNLKKGESYYSGEGGNKALNSPEEVGKALDVDRAKKLGTSKPALSENVSKYESGQKVAETSVANQVLKKQGASGTTVIIDNSQTNISQSAPSKQKTLAQGSSPDLPAHQQG